MNTLSSSRCTRLARHHAGAKSLVLGLSHHLSVEHRLILRSLCEDMTYEESLALTGLLPRWRLRRRLVQIQAIVVLIRPTIAAIEFIYTLIIEINLEAYVHLPVLRDKLRKCR